MKGKFQAITAVCILILGMLCMVTGACADTATDLGCAQKLYEAKDYDGAIQILKGFTTTDSAIAPKVMQLIGLCYIEKKDWASARDSVHSFYVITPTNKWHAQAKYTEAECCIQMENIAAAKTTLNEVISKSSGDVWAESAQRRLLLIGTEE